MSEIEQADWRRLLTPAERASMLDDIARVSLAVGARLFPEQPWSEIDVAEGALTRGKSPLERLSFLESILPVLTQAVPQIGHSPLTTALSRVRPVAPPLRARRVQTSALLKAARRGPSLRFLDETVTLLSLDTPENRAVYSFLWVLQRDSKAIGEIAEADEEAEAAERASNCARRLRGLLALPCWEEVILESAAWTQPPTARAAQRSEYVRVFREMARYKRDFRFEWKHPTLALPMRETWKLYETWCLFSVLDALCALGYIPTTSDLFRVKESRLTWVLATDAASRILLRSPTGKRLSLTYNQTFAEGRQSLSHTMQPDIVLAEGNRLWILDAKFKSYALPGDEGSDINQMHAYRDAIVDDLGKRTVARAWCLYAGQAGLPNRPRLTYGRADEAAVGALCLRPGGTETLTDLQALLTGWLRPDETGAVPPSAVPPSFPGT